MSLQASEKIQIALALAAVVSALLAYRGLRQTKVAARIAVVQRLAEERYSLRLNTSLMFLYYVLRHIAKSDQKLYRKIYIRNTRPYPKNRVAWKFEHARKTLKAFFKSVQVNKTRRKFSNKDLSDFIDNGIIKSFFEILWPLENELGVTMDEIELGTPKPDKAREEDAIFKFYRKLAKARNIPIPGVTISLPKAAASPERHKIAST